MKISRTFSIIILQNLWSLWLKFYTIQCLFENFDNYRPDGVCFTQRLMRTRFPIGQFTFYQPFTKGWYRCTHTLYTSPSYVATTTYEGCSNALVLLYIHSTRHCRSTAVDHVTNKVKEKQEAGLINQWWYRTVHQEKMLYNIHRPRSAVPVQTSEVTDRPPHTLRTKPLIALHRTASVSLPVIIRVLHHRCHWEGPRQAQVEGGATDRKTYRGDRLMVR